MESSAYRKGVCVVLTRQTSTSVLVCHRIGTPAGQGWQFPQGGIDPRLPLLAEARRELREEIGTDDIRLLRTTEGEHRYDFPPARQRRDDNYIGQSHRWLLAELLAADSALSFEHEPVEFDRFEWVSATEALARVVWFKKEAYRGALQELGLV